MNEFEFSRGSLPGGRPFASLKTCNAIMGMTTRVSFDPPLHDNDRVHVTIRLSLTSMGLELIYLCLC